MECRWKTARNESLAMVVRQFSPSRIERDLLAQVFDVVVSGAVGDQGSSASKPVSASESRTGSDEFESSMKPTMTRSAA